VGPSVDEVRVDTVAGERPTPQERALWRRHPVGTFALAGFVVLGAWGASSWLVRPHAPDYSGRTVAAHFDFDCTNGIFWKDPASDYSWWAGYAPNLPPDLDTSRSTPGTPRYHHTAGHLHFDDATHATFTSEAGGRLILTRQPLKQWYIATCGIDPTED
jgi:hypothetical protein